VLFADLVGFTARAEHLDPEDVREILDTYYARLRSEIERYGGVVEKFIGDAVVAVFGAPTAHGDDPERAVRAALAVREAVAELKSTPGRRSSRSAQGRRPARRWSPATSSTLHRACRRLRRRTGS
jgi:class 3 adenylate cyclase